MARASQFTKPGYRMVSFAADADVDLILARNIPLYGDRSKAIRALILAGSGSEAQRKLLEQEALMDNLRLQLQVAQDALAEATMATKTAAASLPPKKPAIDWSKYPPDVAAELKKKVAEKHPGAV